MGTDKVAFVEKRGGATGSGPDRNRKSRKYALRMRNRYILYYYYTSSTVVPLRMTDRATGNNVTPKGSLGCAHAQHEAGGVPPFFRVFSPEMTLPVGVPRVNAYATGSWGFLPIRESFHRTFSNFSFLFFTLFVFAIFLVNFLSITTFLDSNL